MAADRPAGPLGAPPSVHVLAVGTRVRVVLVGEVDAQLGPDLRGALDDAVAIGGPVEVDVRHVTFMDSTGLGFLARLSAVGGSVALVEAPPQVRQLVELAGLSSVVRLVDAAPADQEPGVVTDADAATR